MKKIATLTLALMMMLLAGKSYAVVVVQHQEGETTATATAAAAADFTVADFLNMTPKQYAEQSGEKMSFTKKLAFKMVQNKVKKQVAKGKVDASAPASGNTMSLLSLIFGGVGLLSLVLPIGIFGLLLGVAGLVLGLVAMKKEGSNVMNLLGTIFGGLTVLLFLVAVIFVASIL
jgi:hypothetical protein